MTRRRTTRWRSLAIGVVLVGGLLAVALWPETVTVEVATAARRPLMVTIDELGETRVRDRYVVSAPVTGRVERIAVEAGDTVAAGALLTRVRPETPTPLDARTRAEAQAALDTARAARGRTEAERARADDALVEARREAARAEQLLAGGALSRQQLDARTDAVRQAEAAARAAAFAESQAAAAERQAAARLTASPAAAGGAAVPVRAPASGVVLKRLRESEAVVPAGEPLVEIGDPSRLEIVADLLSVDAVRVPAGARALVEGWGGAAVLEARVRLVEPAGFTKVSALGVEEQRVNVRLDFVDPAAARAALGDAYRVEVRIVLWEAPAVLTVPTGALFRDGEQWAVYAVVDGRAVRTVVELGHRTTAAAEILAGVSEGDTVIVFPPDGLQDGARVTPRSAGP
ncbi:MAG: efflux RND transporter periplasmic adaptor subunit [Vicinamibacterales bacterium]